MLKDGRVLLKWCVLALAAGAAACDSPTVTDAPYSVNVPAGSRVLTPVTADTAVAVTDTADLFPNCTVDSSRCPGTGTKTLTEPDGTPTKIRTLGDSAKTTITVGTSKFTFELAIRDNNSPTGGDFIGVIYKDGVFVGYFGYCVYLDGVNSQYTTTDGAGNTYIHWENTHADTTKKDMYHYIYDPKNNELKIYHKKADGTTVLVYQGPPIKNAENIPPPDPAAGAGPYTGENQYAPGSIPTTGTSTGTTGGTTTTSPTSPTPTTGTTTTTRTSGTFATSGSF
jgi:hypothetical protein